MGSVLELFDWLPGSLKGLFVGAVAIIFLVAIFKLIAAIIKIITDLIPGW